MDTELTQGQKGARTLLVMETMMRKIPLTDAEYKAIILGTPYAEWTPELKEKTKDFSRIVEVEDAKASQAK